MIYLASQSPQRAELLDQLGVAYTLLSVEVDERPEKGEAADDYVRRLAQAKAEAGWQRVCSGLTVLPVLSADTAVVLDGKILGKPRDREHAMAMLQLLSGRSHRVLTAVCLMYAQCGQALSESEVCFRSLSELECAAYWATGEPRDKAGAYAIQGKAAQFIQHLQGSYSGVMGLPLFETAELLAAADIPLLHLRQ